MFRVAICEDCPKETELIRSLLDRYQASRPSPYIHKQSFFMWDALLRELENGQTYDLFLLDIIMPEKNGIELARILREKGVDVPFVFLTSSADYALNAFAVSAVQYLLKPVDENLFFPLLDKIVTAEKKTSDGFFMFSMPERIIKIPLSTICYIELNGHILCATLDDGSKLFSRSIRVPFEKSIAQLLKDSRFLYAHKSFVLNMAHVQEMTSGSFLMSDGTIIPIPRYKYTTAKTKYLDYLSELGTGFMRKQKLL